MSLKHKIQENVVNPVAYSRGVHYEKIAVVKRADEINNLCDVEYIDKDGYKSNKVNVPVKIYSPSMEDWFPEEGDIVMIEERGSTVAIIGIPPFAYGTNVKSQNRLESDFLSDNLTTDVEGGYIL